MVEEASALTCKLDARWETKSDRLSRLSIIRYWATTSNRQASLALRVSRAWKNWVPYKNGHCSVLQNQGGGEFLQLCYRASRENRGRCIGINDCIIIIVADYGTLNDYDSPPEDRWPRLLAVGCSALPSGPSSLRNPTLEVLLIRELGRRQRAQRAFWQQWLPSLPSLSPRGLAILLACSSSAKRAKRK